LYLHDRLDATLRSSIGESRSRALEVPAVTLHSLFEAHGLESIDILKADIEGAEVDALLNASAKDIMKARQITVEFHDWLDPSLAQGVRDVMRRLQLLGFQMIRFSRTNGDVLFIRPPIGAAQTLLVIGEKYARGLSRIARRWVARARA
jgi:hypothetical protein